MTTVAQRFAELIQARANCAQSGNAEWFERHTDRIAQLNREAMPHGAGFDNGVEVVLDSIHSDAGCSTGSKLVFRTAFHHMDEHGGYAGWTDHIVTVKPAFIGDFDLTVSGRDRNQIKDYIGETFAQALGADAPDLD